MTSAFDFYWMHLGLPLSRAKGALVDRAPFPVLDLLLSIGLIATVLCVGSWISFWRRRSQGAWIRLVLFLFGPFLLLVLAADQGALPFGLDPTAWRPSLASSFGADSLSEPEFRAWVKAREDRLAREFNWQAYESLSEREALPICNRSLDSVLVDLGLPPGRSVRAIKAMGPLTTAIGLIYGGPGYHDPLTEEIALVRPDDLPTSHAWRLLAVCHESAHAKGFTREVDAEILTQLALLRVRDPRFRTLADIHFLQKTGLRVHWPDSLVAESKRVGAERQEAERRHAWIARLARWSGAVGVQNSGTKYGTRTTGQAWNPRQPFFSAIHRLEGREEAPVDSVADRR